MFKHLEKYQIVLGSNSPRRQSLLKEMGFDFSVQSTHGEESFSDKIPVKEVAEFLAIQKADLFTDFGLSQLYITADTVVITENEILGKPSNFAEAVEMLQKLSGKWHQVITGVCLKSKEKQTSFSVTTEVLFKTLSTQEITYYVETYKPFDKAGSYGIQEWIGMVGIEKISGSYFNVVGLPTQVLFEKMKIY